MTGATLGIASGRPSSRVPWKQIGEQNCLFISAEFRPPGFTLREPSDMNKATVEAFLTLWTERQEQGIDSFRFQRCLRRGSIHEHELALYDFEVPQMHPIHRVAPVSAAAGPSLAAADAMLVIGRDPDATAADINMHNDNNVPVTLQTSDSTIGGPPTFTSPNDDWLDPDIFPGFDNFLANCTTIHPDLLPVVTPMTNELFPSQNIPQHPSSNIASEGGATNSGGLPIAAKKTKGASKRTGNSKGKGKRKGVLGEHTVAPPPPLRGRPKPKPILSAAERATTSNRVAAALDNSISAASALQNAAGPSSGAAAEQSSNMDGQPASGAVSKRIRQPKRQFEFSAKDGIQQKKKRKTK